MTAFLTLIALLTILCSGCTPVLSENARKSADSSLTFQEIRRDPEAYLGRQVIVGGTIAGVKNSREGSRLEVVQFPLDGSLYPSGRLSLGRFLAQATEFLDPMVYRRGRSITLFGDILGKQLLPLDETEYSYPVLQIRELHLWPDLSTDAGYYPYPPFYDPYYLYAPFEPTHGPYRVRPFPPFRPW